MKTSGTNGFKGGLPTSRTPTHETQVVLIGRLLEAGAKQRTTTSLDAPRRAKYENPDTWKPGSSFEEAA